jgi:hypothetical protein
LVTVEKLYSSVPATLQWLVFDERLQTDTNDDISSEIQSYIDFEADLASRVYPAEVTTPLRNIISEWFSGLCISTTAPCPKFGPGATASTGRVAHVEKALNFDADPQSVSLFCDWFYRDEDEISLPIRSETTRRNRIIFVPKNALKHRIISAEPIWLGWMQQLLKDILYNYIEKHPRMYTWFSNQAYSRKLALEGSASGAYATVDFSSASDSITVTLVSELYKGTELHELLLDTRSIEAEMPDGRIVPLTKFAPMGSATCFAVMDSIFLSICEDSVRKVLNRPGRYGDYTVYGDDVIIRSDCLEQFETTCKQLKLEFNLEKSYSTQSGLRYRESCGIEALNGVDITPVRYSRFQDPIIASAPVNRKYWESTFDLMNRLLDSGYLNTRSACVELIKFSLERGKTSNRRLARNIWNCTMRIDASDYAKGYDGPMALVVPDGTATNFRTKTRRNPDLQCSECRCLVPVASPIDYHDGSHKEIAAYTLWFYAANHRPNLPYDKSIDITGCAGTKPDKWVWRWCRL